MIIAESIAHTVCLRSSCGYEQIKKRKAKGENPTKRISASCPPDSLSACLKREAQSQANCPAIVNALIRIALCEPPEVWVEIDSRNRQ